MKSWERIMLTARYIHVNSENGWQRRTFELFEHLTIYKENAIIVLIKNTQMARQCGKDVKEQDDKFGFE